MDRARQVLPGKFYPANSADRQFLPTGVSRPLCARCAAAAPARIRARARTFYFAAPAKTGGPFYFAHAPKPGELLFRKYAKNYVYLR